MFYDTVVLLMNILYFYFGILQLFAIKVGLIFIIL